MAWFFLPFLVDLSHETTLAFYPPPREFIRLNRYTSRQIFFRKNASNSTVKFGPNCDWTPIRKLLNHVARPLKVESILTAFRTFAGLAAWLNDFRIGWKLVSSHGLDQISLWSLRRFSEKNLAWPNVHPEIKLDTDLTRIVSHHSTLWQNPWVS